MPLNRKVSAVYETESKCGFNAAWKDNSIDSFRRYP
jgi:hypothetical protein